MLDIVKALTPKSKQKPPPVKEEPKPEPKKSLIPLPQSLGGKVFAGFVVLHVVFLAYFIWFMVTASITETEDEVEITKTTQLMTFIVHSVRNYIGF